MNRISRRDSFGVFYVRKPNGKKWDSYYRTLDALKPLFRDRGFLKVVKGFYLNTCGDFDAVRISYFVDGANSQEAVYTFRTSFSSIGLTEIRNHESPRKIVVAALYGGKEFEERFRNFLVLETRIGLELIDADLLHARILFATYRWQVRKASLSFKEHFEPTFKELSPTYNALSDEERNQFFADLKEWPNPPQVDWAHMMVNLVLGCDWNRVLADPNYLTPGNPLSISDINELVKELGFQIPDNWRPSNIGNSN